MTRPPNLDKPIRRVRHADLERDGPGKYASTCPVCKIGRMGMRRRQSDSVLLEIDVCMYCGQQFEYTDIAELRLKDWAKNGEWMNDQEAEGKDDG